MFINALTPVVSFGQLKEPKRNEYTSKQESLASQVREISNNKDSLSGKSYMSYLEEDLNLDVLILPSEHRKKLDVYAVDRSTGEKDILAIFSPETKPKNSHFSNYIHFVKEEISESNRNTIGMLVAGICMLGLLCLGGNKNSAAHTIDPIKQELSTKGVNSLKQDTLQLTAKLFK